MNTETSRTRSPASVSSWTSFTTSTGCIRLWATEHPLILRRTHNEELGSLIRGAAPDTPRFIAVAPESLYCFGAALTAPAIPASESTLGSHLCVALSSAQMFSEWTTATQPCNDFSLNGDYPLTRCLTPRVHFRPLRRAHEVFFCSTKRT